VEWTGGWITEIQEYNLELKSTKPVKGQGLMKLIGGTDLQLVQEEEQSSAEEQCKTFCCFGTAAG
jgi:hypothetical protein